MKVRFKGNDPRAGREVNLDPATAKRYIKEGVADAADDQTADAGQAGEGEQRERAPAAKKTGSTRR